MINKHNRIYSVLLFFLTRQTTSPPFLTKHINIISYTYNKRSNKFGVLKCIQNEARPPSEWTIYSIVAEPECTKTHNHHTAQSRRNNHTSHASQPAHHMYTIAKWLRWDISLQHNFEYHKTSRFVDVVYIHALVCVWVWGWSGLVCTFLVF